MARKRAKPVDDTPVEGVQQTKPRPVDKESVIVRPGTQELQAVVAELTQQLATLGDSTSAVSKTLAANSIVGERLDDHKCPIANYLKAKVKLPKHSYLSVQHKAVLLLSHFAGEQLCQVPLPKGVVKFIEAWDSGKYNRLADVKE